MNHALIMLCLIVSSSALCHGGGLDAQRCHSKEGARHCHPRPTQTYYGTVTKVSDGDTARVSTPEGRIKVRLAGIDCPERKQRHGPAAREALIGLVANQAVKVVQTDIDRYKRVVAKVYVDGADINRAMVQGGHCWAYVGYVRDKALPRLQAEAKAARRGLWVHDNPTPPWIWRKARR